MKNAKYRSGFVLLMTNVMIIAVTIVVGGVIGYVSYAARHTRILVAKNRCRFAAQSVIEQAKCDIQSGFSDYLGISTTVKVDPRQAESYNWFDNVSADRRTIGITDTKHKAVTLTSPKTLVNGCNVYVGIGKYIDHDANSPIAYVPIVATAEHVYPDGQRVTATIQEYICFATGQSKVFNYAYFVNNYGWMNGSSITINGDMRANGDVSLTSSTVNGFIYAARNPEVGATGRVKLTSNPQVKNQSGYRSSVINRARPDRGDYDTTGAYDAPASSGTIVAPRYDSNGNVTSGTVGASSGKPLVQADSDPIPMPFVSYLDDYVEYAKEKGGTLECPAVSYTDSIGTTHNLSTKRISAHYNGVGPSEKENLADKGSLVLIGTQSNPIKINGPVVVDGDVIIKGYVSGQGTIYAGRNVHIIGDIKYKNAPTWNHPDSNDETVENNNASKDMLGLIAKGNIVVGDCSSSSWLGSVQSYINSGSSSVVEQYACDESDADIGYPSVFLGDYTAMEFVSGKGVNGTGYFAKVRQGTEEYTVTETEQVWVEDSTASSTSGNGSWGNWGNWGNWWGGGGSSGGSSGHWTTVEKQVTKTRTALTDQLNRKYYETVCDDKILSSLKDSAGVGQIDAVLYNNHGIFGTPGRSNSTFNLNGSLVCRDEALIFSGNGINFNWDIRLMPKANNKVTSIIGLPVGPQEPYTVSWQEIPDSLNTAYMQQRNEDD